VLIEGSITSANDGRERVSQMSTAIDAITQSAAKVRGLVDAVSVASREQSRGIDQVSHTIAQMEKGTQTTAATAEESAAASEELSGQAATAMEVVHQLATLVGSDGTRKSKTDVRGMTSQRTMAVAPRRVQARTTKVWHIARPAAPSPRNRSHSRPEPTARSSHHGAASGRGHGRVAGLTVTSPTGVPPRHPRSQPAYSGIDSWWTRK